VKQLIERLGFDAINAGPLVNARCLEPLSLLNIRLGRFLGLSTSIGFSLLRSGRSIVSVADICAGAAPVRDG
jgi:hypothetical protein